MRYIVVYDQTQRNYSAYVPLLPVVVITGRTMASLEANACSAIKAHLRGTAGEAEPVEVELVHAADYSGDMLTLDGQRLPAKPVPTTMPT